jgi:hypothetical protein
LKKNKKGVAFLGRMIMMRKNDMTVEQLQKKIDDILSKQEEQYLFEEQLEKHQIYYQKLKKEDTNDTGYSYYHAYFYCKDGTGYSRLVKDLFLKKIYMRGGIPIEKLSQDELDKLAKRYQKLEEEMFLIQEVLNQNKLRGLFAKLKSK